MKKVLLFSLLFIIGMFSLLSLVSAIDVSNCQVINSLGYYEQTANLVYAGGETVCIPVPCPPDSGSGKPEACPVPPCQVTSSLPACIVINVSGVVYNGHDYTITDYINRRSLIVSDVNNVTIKNVRVSIRNGAHLRFYEVDHCFLNLNRNRGHNKQNGFCSHLFH